MRSLFIKLSVNLKFSVRINFYLLSRSVLRMIAPSDFAVVSVLRVSAYPHWIGFFLPKF
jgi:hypothetical protein